VADGEKCMKDFKIHYDEKSDVLHLGKEGREEEVVEVAPGLNIELDENGKIIGVEILHASRQLRDVIQPIGKRISA
jgi:uncharacterized protein YuzE